MYGFTVNELHAITGGRLRLAARAPLHAENAAVGPITIDSRKVEQGSVFWALQGKEVNAAEFASDAFARGAAGVVAAEYVQPPSGRWALQVDHSHQALVGMARHQRAHFHGRVIAVTGSVGKTTARQMIRAALDSSLVGSSSPKNYNNQVGLPLAMLAMAPEHDFAVLELAASAVREIAALAELCQPHIGVITRIGEAHLDGFGSLAGVARAKTELLASLPEDGWAVLNGDDPQLRRWATQLPKHVLWCGRSLDNDLVATNVSCRRGRLKFEVDGQEIIVPAWGRHHLTGALAAVAVGRILGLSDAEVARGLARFQPAPARCQVRRSGQATIIDDSYNASPLSMHAALELLRDFDSPGRRIVVCGDMRELGEASARLHRQLGDHVVTLCGADLLVACGQHADDVVAGARAAGMPREKSIACRRPEDIFAHPQAALAPGDVVLFKGSRAMAMENLVQQLLAQEELCTAEQ